MSEVSEEQALPDAPPAFVAGDDSQLGIYRTPFERLDLGAGGIDRLRLKEWHYLSFTTDDWFVAVGLVQLGYVGNLFSYAFDRNGDLPALEYSALSPMGRSLKIASSSVLGTTSWKTRRASVSIAANDGWDVDLDIPLGDERLTGQAHIERRESLAMLHRLDPGHVAYTHKAAGWPASGELHLGGRAIGLDGGLGTSDWTRAQAKRVTVWKWCSLNGFLDDGRPIGLNLSAEVYDDERGHSVENAAWIDGRVRPLEGVRFEVPLHPQRERWRINSLESDEVDLEFDPRGAREEHLNVGLLATDFVQPYGRFEGKVLGHDVTGCFGVVEDHRAVW
jgi:hypothetical protein